MMSLARQFWASVGEEEPGNFGLVQRGSLTQMLSVCLTCTFYFNFFYKNCLKRGNMAKPFVSWQVLWKQNTSNQHKTPGKAKVCSRSVGNHLFLAWRDLFQEPGLCMCSCSQAVFSRANCLAQWWEKIWCWIKSSFLWWQDNLHEVLAHQ